MPCHEAVLRDPFRATRSCPSPPRSRSSEPDGTLLAGVSATAVGVSGRAAVANRRGAVVGGAAELLRDLAVLHLGALRPSVTVVVVVASLDAVDPVADVLVQLAARGAALAAVDLAAGGEDREGVARGVRLRRRRGRGRRDERPRVSPHPLHIVGPFAAGAEGHRAVHAPVDGVELPAGEPEAGAVDGIEEVEDRVVQFGRQVRQRQRRPWPLRQRHRLLVHHRVRPLRRRQSRSLAAIAAAVGLDPGRRRHRFRGLVVRLCS